MMVWCTISHTTSWTSKKIFHSGVIDGVKMSDPSSVSGDFDFNNILTCHLSRVEILKVAPKLSLWKWCHWWDNKYYYKKGKDGFPQKI